MQAFKPTSTLYTQLATQSLKKIVDIFENHPKVLDLNESDGIITFTFNKIGKYIFNKQPYLKEIWVSSPLSGPKHFYIGEGRKFYDTKNQQELFDCLKHEINKIDTILGKSKI